MRESCLIIFLFTWIVALRFSKILLYIFYWDIIHIPQNSLLKKYNLIVFSVFKELCNYCYYLIPGRFHHTQRNHISISRYFPFLTSSRPWQPLWICLFGLFHINGIRGLLWLASFTQCNIFKVHPCHGIYINTLFLLMAK